jgi:hypothetical protein
MSSINTNDRRISIMRLRSATQRQIARQNTPSALARRTRILETQRTNLANIIRELETDLRQQRQALAALTIEVDRALSRREDERERYEIVKKERDDLRRTIINTFRQDDLGMEYKELKQRHDELVKNRGIDTENIKTRFDTISNILVKQVESGLASIIVKKNLAKEIYRRASEHHYSLYQSQQYIIGVISDLERKLEKALNRDRELNQARGKRQYHTRHKKGKKRKHTRKRRL